jgi:N-acetylmuramoyl-L-alanine amidase
VVNIIPYPSPNFNDRPEGAKIDYIIIHYTDMETMQASLARLCDPVYEVSSHYAIDEDGTIYQLVDDAKRAWHAGKSSWMGVENLNHYSIGIELQNRGYHCGYAVTGVWPEFPDTQINSLKELLKNLMHTYSIPAEHILGHQAICPGTKIDPGPAFPWGALKDLGCRPHTDSGKIIKKYNQ